MPRKLARWAAAAARRAAFALRVARDERYSMRHEDLLRGPLREHLSRAWWL